MDVSATGFVKRINGPVLRADIFETRKSGEEYARTADGLILFPGTYEWENVYEYLGEEDRVEVEALLSDLGTAGAL